jgi:hypothetical protein
VPYTRGYLGLGGNAEEETRDGIGGHVFSMTPELRARRAELGEATADPLDIGSLFARSVE